MTTKYYSGNKPNPYADTPTPISDEYTKPDTIDFMCSYCQCKLLKMSDEGEYYCNRCSISQYPDVEDVRSKTRITTPIGLNLEPCLSYAPDPNEAFFNDNNPKPEGAFKALKDRGLKITNYTEKDGAGRPLKKNRWT
ncbi:hypothetical protein BH18THE2_BH18THE2_28500 [soil metagenome]